MPDAANLIPASVRESDVEIRHCVSTDDYEAVYALQGETWGTEASVLVSTPILKVAQRVGGVTAGAFAPDGTLLGFVFGMTGPQHGRLVHWSDMLAVRPEARDLGLGRRLKAFQREACLALGVAAMQWTYDPLVARNAHLNLMRLGAWPIEYVPEMYGNSDSPLHAGFGTDRFIVEWPLADGAARPGTALVPQLSAIDGAPLLTSATHVDVAPVAAGAALVRIAIPSDIHAVAAAAPATAVAWRRHTREAFEAVLAAGYRAVGVQRAVGASHDVAYLFVHPAVAATLGLDAAPASHPS